MNGNMKQNIDNHEYQPTPWNLPWYECMVAIDDKRRQNGDTSSISSHYSDITDINHEEELMAKIAHDYKKMQNETQDDEEEVVMMSKAHADAIQEQMAEYYNLLDLFESMKVKNNELERRLEKQKSDKTLQDTLEERGFTRANSDASEFEKQLDSLKSMVVNLRKNYEHKLSQNHKKDHKAKNSSQCSMNTCSTSRTRDSSQSSHTDNTNPSSSSLFIRIIKDLRCETLEVDKH